MGILKKNVIATVSQVLIFAVCQFLLYRLILIQLGIEKLGLWSIITSFTMTASIGNFGASGSSIVMFVAKYAAEENYVKVRSVISTSLIFVCFSVFCTLLVLYPITLIFLSKSLSVEFYELAKGQLIILSFIYFGLYSIAFLLWSVVDGYQKYVKRVVFHSFAQIGNLVLSIILMKKFDLQGLFWAQIIQSAFLAVAGFIVVYQIIPFKLLFSKDTFKELFGYGIKLQAVSLLSTISEPIIKFFLTKFGGLSFTGFYEMANKLTNQIRSPIMVSLQPLIPVIAENKGKDPEKVLQYYRTAVRQITELILFITCSFLILLPLIAHFWLGEVNEIFIWMSVALCIGYFFNTVASPINFVNLGTGELNGNIIQQIIQTVLIISLLCISGYFANNVYGISISLGLSIAIASLWLIYTFHRHNRISIGSTFLIPEIKWLAIVIALLSCLALYKVFPLISLGSFIATSLIVYGLSIGIFFISFLKHKVSLVLRG